MGDGKTYLFYTGDTKCQHVFDGIDELFEDVYESARHCEIPTFFVAYIFTRSSFGNQLRI